MYQHLKLAIDRRFTSVREVLDYIDTHFSIINIENIENISLEQLVRDLKSDEKKEVLDKINKIRNRRITSRL